MSAANVKLRPPVRRPLLEALRPFAEAGATREQLIAATGFTWGQIRDCVKTLLREELIERMHRRGEREGELRWRITAEGATYVPRQRMTVEKAKKAALVAIGKPLKTASKIVRGMAPPKIGVAAEKPHLSGDGHRPSDQGAYSITKMRRSDGVLVTFAKLPTYDARFQRSPQSAAQFRGEFQRAGIGRDITTGRAWA